MMEMFDRNEQAIACRKLLAAVVITAVRDACLTPPKRSRFVGESEGMPMSIDAFTAMRFLFDDSVSGLKEYLQWFDIDPGQYRMRLRDMMFSESAHKVNGFETMDRRNFRYNYGMWMRLKDRLPVTDIDGEDDE